MKFMTVSKALAALGFLVVGGIASASTITFTQTDTILSAPTDVNDASAVFNDFGSIGAPVNATLTGVTLEFLITETLNSLNLTDGNPTTAETAHYTASANFDAGDTASATDGTNLDDALANSLNNGDDPAPIFKSGSVSLNPLQSDSSFALPAILTEDTGQVAGTTSAYLGTGTFDLNYSTLSSFTIAGGGDNVSASQVTVTGATATVIYTYTTPSAVPEPASFLLLGGGLIAIGSLRRRKKTA